MYFSIPDITEISAKQSTDQHAYTLFNIHINGIHHCSLRYSQLRTFNDELQRLLPSLMIHIQPFPPKKFFSLSVREIDERRLLLERYLQSIVQQKSLIVSSYFTEFFLNAQRETYFNDLIEKTIPDKIDFTIRFLNKHEINLENLSPDDNFASLFDACATKIQLENDYYSYFSLFLYNLHDNQLNLIRPLFPFESPYISLKQATKIHENNCLVLKKSYWDLNYDLPLLDNRCTRNLVFLQAEYDIQQSQAFYSSNIYQQLDVFRQNKQLHEYILLARTSKFYGYILLHQCSINDLMTRELSQCLLAMGNNELVCHLIDGEKKDKEVCFRREISFKVTRIRCWKVNWTKSDLNITFEYLIRKDHLQWITIYTEQAPLVSTCLQSMVDEILTKTMNATSSVSVVEPVKQRTNVTNGLATRTKSDLDRLNNNELFDKGGGDDDL